MANDTIYGLMAYVFGVKQSGIGREGGSEGIVEFLEEKYIALTA